MQYLWRNGPRLFEKKFKYTIFLLNFINKYLFFIKEGFAQPKNPIYTQTTGILPEMQNERATQRNRIVASNTRPRTGHKIKNFIPLIRVPSARRQLECPEFPWRTQRAAAATWWQEPDLISPWAAITQSGCIV